jgi:putative oxidoreductase
MMNGVSDELILVARLLLATLFLIFGWRKVRDYSGTVAIGTFTRPAAGLMALYALGTALIGHRYWTVKDKSYVDSLEGFYKDLGLMGGFLLLCITGAGKYSIDALSGIAAP